jgi:hypothetical protein
MSQYCVFFLAMVSQIFLLYSCCYLHEEIRVLVVSYVFAVGRMFCIYHVECRAVGNKEVSTNIRYCK